MELENITKELNLVADDILLVFRNTFSGCSQVDEELKEFSLNSGLTINKEKCELVHFSNGIPIGHLQPNLPHELVQQHAHVPQGGLAMLEHFLSHFFQIVNSNPKLE